MELPLWGGTVLQCACTAARDGAMLRVAKRRKRAAYCTQRSARAVRCGSSCSAQTLGGAGTKQRSGSSETWRVVPYYLGEGERDPNLGNCPCYSKRASN